MTLIGNQRPRIEHIPAPVNGTLGEEAIDLSAAAGLELDEWQQYLLHNACSVRSVDDPEGSYYNPYTGRVEPKWQTLENGIVVPRQNGKGSFIEARELAGLFLFGERTIIHSAHLFDTSLEGFKRICTLIEDTPSLSKRVKKISNSHGSEGIELKSGQRLIFKARTKSGGRGFTCDCLIMDECMSLGSLAMGAMMPTLSARPNAQIFYAGSAGNQNVADCSQLGRLRSRALRGMDSRLFFAEWSIDACNDFCPPGCDEHDDPSTPEAWGRANPGMGIRISVEYIRGEFNSMDREMFLVERCSVGNYPSDESAWKIIPEAKWIARQDEFSQIEGRFALAVDVAPDMSTSCIVACGSRPGEPDTEHVEITSDSAITDAKGDPLLDHRAGVKFVVPRIIELWKRHKPSCVVIDPVGHAGAFVDDLEKAGVRVVSPNGREFAQACGELYASVSPRKGETASLAHIGQPTLTAAVAQADKRDLMDMWAWSKGKSEGDITPLVAATLARWGFKHDTVQKAAAPFAYYE